MIKQYRIEITLFLSGAVGMALEIVGSRLLAPYFGSSIHIWTGLIGIVLGSLSLGYFLGGRLADRHLNEKILALVLSCASFSIVISFIIYQFLFPWLKIEGDNRLIALFSIVILFAAPSVILGMISPYAIRLRINSLKDSGSIIGTLYAISTIGSIFGTFISGYFLISTVGSRNIILVLSMTLAVLSLFYFDRLQKKIKIALVVLIIIQILFIQTNRTLIKNEFDTMYERYFVVNSIDNKTSKPVRTLTRFFDTTESAVFLDGDKEPPIDYVKFYRINSAFVQKPEKALLIGGGAFVSPRDFLRLNPESNIDVAEIDQGLLEIAKDNFFLTEDARMKIFYEDGRAFVNRQKDTNYDILFMDAFNSDTSVPFQLTTLESDHKYYDLLSEKGVFIANIIGSVEGIHSKFTKSEFKTLRKVFGDVSMFAVQDPKNLILKQNLIIVATKNGQRTENYSSEIAGYLSKKVILPVGYGDNAMILTDDFAPVEQLISI